MILNKSVSPFTRWEIENKSESYEYFKKYYENSVLFTSVKKIRDYVINKSLEKNKYKLNENDLFLEFGVFKGESLNFFSDTDFSPECCPSDYNGTGGVTLNGTTGGGCACINNEQIEYINTRGGNRNDGEF